MKNLFRFVLITFVGFFWTSVTAQNVAINNTGNPPDPSAILDISGVEKGILIPRMSSSERVSINNPAQGLMVFDTETRSFWYYDSSWFEIGKAGEVTGPAGGDLSGTYPDPNVKGIQGLPVVAGVPADKQILKWDIAANNWKGRNDSLFLPYDVSANGSVLFGISNTNNANGNVAIKGKQSVAGSGLTLPISMGVWGDNSTGGGIAGTSNSGIGTYGISTLNYGVWGSSAAPFYAGVYGTSQAVSGIGVYGDISQSGYAVYGRTSGTAGSAGLFNNFNVDNNQPALQAYHSGKGSILTLNNTSAATTTGMILNNHGAGYGIVFQNHHPTTGNSAMILTNHGKGSGIHLMNPNTANPLHGIDAYTAGTGDAIHATGGLGSAGNFIIANEDNNSIALKSSTLGRGMAGSFTKDNTTGSISDIHDPCVYIDNHSKGQALKIKSLHSPSVNHGVSLEYDGQAFGMHINSVRNGLIVNSGTIGSMGIMSINTGGGTAIKGTVNTASNPAILGESVGSNGTGVKGIGTGQGAGVYAQNTSETFSSAAVMGVNNAPTVGIGVYGTSTGTGGVGVYGEVHSTKSAIYGINTFGWNGVEGRCEGDSPTGVRGVADGTAGTFGIGVIGQNDGDGDGVRGLAGANGAGIAGLDHNSQPSRAGYFESSFANNTSEAVKIQNSGIGKSFLVVANNSNNTSPAAVITKSGTSDFMILENNAGDNKIRFDNTGKGFFNGGTQNSGADIAESFAVENEVEAYEPGDVLVISINTDRTVTKSTEPYSTLVAGVYATKPGVLLTEHDIESSLEDEVPMGVVGVIPTKVCLENGPIQRGDFIVTSSVTGVAMKGDPDKVKLGQVIGKALENFDSGEIGKIKVLVSVK